MMGIDFDTVDRAGLTTNVHDLGDVVKSNVEQS
jgi:hypothetical protein